MGRMFDAADNITFLGRTDQAGRADGIQCMIHKGHAFVSHVLPAAASA